MMNEYMKLVLNKIKKNNNRDEYVDIKLIKKVVV